MLNVIKIRYKLATDCVDIAGDLLYTPGVTQEERAMRISPHTLLKQYIDIFDVTITGTLMNS